MYETRKYCGTTDNSNGEVPNYKLGFEGCSTIWTVHNITGEVSAGPTSEFVEWSTCLLFMRQSVWGVSTW